MDPPRRHAMIVGQLFEVSFPDEDGISFELRGRTLDCYKDWTTRKYHLGYDETGQELTGKDREVADKQYVPGGL